MLEFDQFESVLYGLYKCVFLLALIFTLVFAFILILAQKLGEGYVQSEISN